MSLIRRIYLKTILIFFFMCVPCAHSSVLLSPGLFDDFKESNHVVKIKVKLKINSKEIDPELKIIKNAGVSGRIEEVYKGDLTVGEEINFEVNYLAQNKKMEDAYAYGHLLYTNVHFQDDEELVFLLKGNRPFNVINIIYDHEIIKDYARISFLDDASAVIELIDLFCKGMFLEKKEVLYELPRIVPYDIKQKYKFLDINSKDFQKLLNKYRANMIETAKEYHPNLEYVVWLGSYMDKSTRKEIMRALLFTYEKVKKELDDLSKKPKESEEIDGDREESRADKAENSPWLVYLSWEERLLGAMSLILETSWNKDIYKNEEDLLISFFFLVDHSDKCDRKILDRAREFLNE